MEKMKMDETEFHTSIYFFLKSLKQQREQVNDNAVPFANHIPSLEVIPFEVQRVFSQLL